MNRLIYGFRLSLAFYLLLTELTAMSQQITKSIPIENWIAFKYRINDVKRFDNFLVKLRATYDSIFHKSDNVTNVEKIPSKEKNTSENTKLEKLIPSESPMTNKITEILKSNKQINDMNVDLFSKSYDNPSTKSSSISRISKNNTWLHDTETAEPLSELEILDDDNVNRSVMVVTRQPSYQLPIVVRAFGNWLGSIFGFTHGAHLMTQSSI